MCLGMLMKGRCSPVKRGRLGQERNEYVLCALVGGRRTWESRNLGRKGIIPVSGEREGELPCRVNHSSACREEQHGARRMEQS